MIEGIQMDPTSGMGSMAVSPAGAFAYQPKVEGYGQNQLCWVDRDGKESPATPEKVDHESPSLSADGSRLVFARGGSMYSLYSVDLGPPLDQRSSRRLTFDFDSYHSLLSPDGASVAYTSNISGSYRTYVQDLAGGKPPRVIHEDLCNPRSWSRDGRWIALSRSSKSGSEIWVVPADGSSPARALVQIKGNAYDPQLSPDLEWLAYVSDGDGISEISVVAFPAGDRRMQVTNGGGSTPRWSHDGTELFYSREGKYYAMTVTHRPALAFGPPSLLFQGDYDSDSSNVGFQPAPDGRFLMNKPILPADRSLRVVVVENFVEEVKEKLAAASPR
jgi:Tol biopolymer transport system component